MEKKEKQNERNKGNNEWYTKWWVWIIIAIVILLIIHVLFSLPAPCDFFVAKWSAGELIILLGTLVLGYVAVYQTQKANKTAEDAAKVSKRVIEKELSEVKPFIDVRQLVKNDTKTLSIERCIMVSTELDRNQYYCRLKKDFSVLDENGETLYFGIKNVCNHDILDIHLQQIKMACCNKNLEEISFSTSICVGSIESGELTALILTVPYKFFVQAAAQEFTTPLGTANTAYVSLHLMFNLLNADGDHYNETVKLKIINAEQPGLYFPVILEKDLRPSIKV